MKANIHPKYQKIKVNCTCGNEFETFSALTENLHIEICNKCHPFWAQGDQKLIDTAGKIEMFKKRFGDFSQLGKEE